MAGEKLPAGVWVSFQAKEPACSLPALKDFAENTDWSRWHVAADDTAALLSWAWTVDRRLSPARCIPMRPLSVRTLIRFDYEVTPCLTAAKKIPERTPAGDISALPLSYRSSKRDRAGFEPATTRFTVEVTPASLLWKRNQRRTPPGVSCCVSSMVGFEPTGSGVAPGSLPLKIRCRDRFTGWSSTERCCLPPRH